jgi:HD-like signal output (HDOD) protein
LWDVICVQGGERALAALTESPVDVVIADLRMPTVDGGALLAATRQLRPGAVRVIMSGHVQNEAWTRAVPLAHQLLQKPFEPADVLALFERISAVRERLPNEQLRELMGSLDTLPVMPPIFAQLIDAFASKSLTEIATLIAQDVGMGAKLLQLASSGFFGPPSVNVGAAVTQLGLENLKSLLISTDSFRVFDAKLKIYVERLYVHARATAGLARQLVSDPSLADVAYVSGLVHGIGELVLASCLPEVACRALNEARASGLPIEEAQRRELGVSHVELGAYLLGLWGLPEAIVDAVARQGQEPGATIDVAGAVHLADRLLRQLEAQNNEGWRGPPPPLDGNLVARAALESRMGDWHALAREAAERSISHSPVVHLGSGRG